MRYKWVYLAGLFDGEGCVHIGWCKKNTKVLKLVTTMSTTNKSICSFLTSSFGGSSRTYYPKNPKHSQVWRWEVQGWASMKLLKKLKPYCIIKKRVIETALKWEKLKRGFCRSNPVTEKEMKKRTVLYNKMKGLNRRGN